MKYFLSNFITLAMMPKCQEKCGCLSGYMEDLWIYVALCTSVAPIYLLYILLWLFTMATKYFKLYNLCLSIICSVLKAVKS